MSTIVSIFQKFENSSPYNVINFFFEKRVLAAQKGQNQVVKCKYRHTPTNRSYIRASVTCKQNVQYIYKVG